MRPPRAVFVSPLMPSRTGNGLAMRMGLFAEALSRIAELHVIVVPVAGVGGASTLIDAIGGRLTHIEAAGRGDTEFTLLSRLSNPQARLNAFRAYGKPSLASLVSPLVLADIAAAINASRPDIVHIGRAYLAPCVNAAPKGAIATLDLDEDDLASYASQAKIELGSGRAIAADWLQQEGLACDALVRKYGERFQRRFVSGPMDARSLADRHPGLSFCVLENGVEIPRVAPRRDDGQTLLFVGSLGYAPNQDGVLWFSREVLPRLRGGEARGCRLWIVGSDPTKEVAALDRRPGVSVLGRVEHLSPLYQRATLSLAPLRSGGGTRIKLLEAAAHGVASVSTTVASRGLPWRPGAAGWRADSTRDFARACLEAMADPDEREARGARARVWSRKHHDRNALANRAARMFLNLIAP